MCNEANKAGFLSIVMQRRGLKSNKAITPIILNSDLTLDFEAAVKFINNKFNNPDIYAVGISMGACLQSRYIGKAKDKCPFKASVAMATPFDVTKVTDELVKPHNYIC